MKKTNPITNHNYPRIGMPGLWPAGSILMTALICLVAQLANAAVQVRTSQLRITVPDGGTSVQSITNYVPISGTPGTETLSVAGSLPTGDSTVFSTLFPLSGTTNFGTSLTNTAINVPDGLYPIDLNVSGSIVNDLIVTLQSGRMWTGTSNVTTTWSSGASWIGGNPPTASSDVLFTWIGGQTNFMLNGNLFANSEVDQNFTIASLRFSQSTNGFLYHSITIDPGKTLSITGANGLSLLQDSLSLGTGMFAVFSGLGGTLNVNNPNASITMLLDNSTQHTLDLQRLGNFTANISRFAVGDYTTYPNYTNLLAEGFATGTPFIMPNKFYVHTYLAMTNVITANYVDPNNYTNSNTNRLYAIEIGNNPFSAPSSSAAQNFSLGITNNINADGVCVSGFGGTTITMNFNPGLRILTNIVFGVSTNYVTNSMYAKFRNTNGTDRMSIFTIGDLANTQTNSSGNTKGSVDFSGNGGGYVDLLVDRFYMSRDRTNTLNSGGDDAQTTYGMGAGIVNANTMVIGDQETGDQPDQGFVYGTLTVSNSGVIAVNNTLHLGYDTADIGDASLPGVSHGILDINAGGTVMANTIGVGGPSGNSGEVGTVGPSGGSAAPNTIALNGGTLIVSNVIGSASCFATNAPTTYSSTYFPGMLGVLTMVNSSLELFINGNNTGTYVNTCQLTSSGSTSNTIVIGSIQNITFPSGGSTNIPLMWIQDASPNASAVSGAFTKIQLPFGYEGALVQDATNTHVLDLNLSQHIPKNLKWEGYVNSTWDTTSTNWLDLATGLHTNYFNGDNAIFDDSTIITNITVSGTLQLIPNSIAITNNTGYYKFSGSSLIGGATLTKAGTGFLEIDSSMAVNTLLNNGTLTGNGSIGGVSVAAGATLNYLGTINGSVTCAGLGLGNGTINGLLTIASSGIFTNFNALNGAFNVQSNGFLYNNLSANITYGLGNTGSISTNGIFVNAGTISGDVLSDGGTFEDLGGGSSITLNSLSVASGGVFYPGADALGNTTINPSGLGGYGFPGAMLLVQGSTTVLNVNNPNTTTITPIFMSFGGSSTAQTENGATLQINNLGSAFTAGQSFTFFTGPPGNTGTSTNTFPVISPATPGHGLAWDLTKLWSNGSIGIVAANSGPALTNSFSVQGTNIISQFSWGPGYFGYRLQTENNPLSIGLSNNWSGIPGSWTNSSESITNTVGTNNAVFYRLVFP